MNVLHNTMWLALACEILEKFYSFVLFSLGLPFLKNSTTETIERLMYTHISIQATRGEQEVPQVVIEAHGGGTVEDDVGAGEQLLHVPLADGQVVLVEVRVNRSDLLLHVGTGLFDFFKQLKHKYKSINKDRQRQHLVLTDWFHCNSQKRVLVVTSLKEGIPGAFA